MTHTNYPIPELLYGCANCYEDRSLPASELYYWYRRGEYLNGEYLTEDAGWRCAGCLDCLRVDSSILPRLDHEIARRDSAARQAEINAALA